MLKKLTKETYENKELKYSFENSPLRKIRQELSDYVSPQDNFSTDLQIPSIPGGRLIMKECGLGKELIGNPKVDFYYFDPNENQNFSNNAYEEIRSSIEGTGLKCQK